MASRLRAKAVVFDVDGVLVEIRFPTVLPATLGITAADAKEFFDGPFLQCLVGEVHLSDALPTYLDRWGWGGTLEEFATLWFETESHINQPMLSLADRLRERGIECYLASTQEQVRARQLEKLLGVGQRFTKAFFSCDLKCKKPEQRFFEYIARDIGHSPQDILLVDDQQANVDGAVAAGWNAVRYCIGAKEVNLLASCLGARDV